MKLLASHSEKLIETDRIIIEAINQNPELFLDIKIEDFARLANTAISTISKFVRRIGFENYRSFQKHLNKSYLLQKEKISLSPKDLKKNDVSVLKKYDFLAINETIKKIDFEMFDRLVTNITDSQKIWIVGPENNFLAAHDLANALNNIGFIAFATSDAFAKSNQLNFLTDHDLLIFISEHSLRKEYQNLIFHLKEQKVKIGLITTVNKFFVNQKVDFVINFFAFSQENCPKIVGNAKIQQIFINNLLINEILKKKGIVIDWKRKIKW